MRCYTNALHLYNIYVSIIHCLKEHALEETSTEETSSQEADCSLHKQELEASKEICAKLENECKLLREQNASLVQTLSMSKENVELLTAEKEELLKNLNIEKQKLKDLKDEIRQFSLAFAQREGLLTSLYSKSKAMVENLKSCRAPIPEILECWSSSYYSPEGFPTCMLFNQLFKNTTELISNVVVITDANKHSNF